MGWTWFAKPQNVKGYMDDMYSNYVDEEHTYRVLKSAIVARKEYYCAVERVNKKTNERVVWAGVAMLDYRPRDRDGYTFGYKDMSEAMGPYLYSCPGSILALLTETTNEYALKWRATNRQMAERRTVVNGLKTGDRIRLASAMRFTDGRERQDFTVYREGRKMRFYSSDGVGCSISRLHERQFSKIEEALA